MAQKDSVWHADRRKAWTVPGCSEISWSSLTERSCRECKLNEHDPCDRDVWRSNLRSAMPVASQLSGGEPTDVDDAPVHAR